jgi:hypothetical protein
VNNPIGWSLRLIDEVRIENIETGLKKKKEQNKRKPCLI